MTIQPADMFGDFEDVQPCPKCGRNLPVNKHNWYFRTHANGNVYRQPRCKSCMKKHSKEQLSQEQYQTRKKEYRKRNRERLTAYQAEWRANNREAHNEYHREYNREYFDTDEWRERHRLHARNRRAKQHASSGTHTLEQIKSLLSIQESKCAYCRCDIEGDYHVDHIVAINSGGANDIYNLVIACPFCNQSKADRDVGEWLEWKGYDVDEFHIRLDAIQSKLSGE